MAWHDTTSHQVTWQNLTRHDTWLDILQPTALPHLASPHNQPSYFTSFRSQPHGIIQHRIAAHHHRRCTMETQPPSPKHRHQAELLKQKIRFGHRTGWLAWCSFSTQSLSFAYSFFSPAEISAPGYPGNFWSIWVVLKVPYHKVSTDVWYFRLNWSFSVNIWSGPQAEWSKTARPRQVRASLALDNMQYINIYM